MKKILIFFLLLTSSAWGGENQVIGFGAPYDAEGEPIQKADPISNTIQGLASLGIPSAIMKNYNLTPSFFEGVKLVYMEGNCLSNGIYMEKSMQLAQCAGAKISLHLSNAAFIEPYRERICALLEAYTDILFIDEKEAYALTHLPPKQAAAFLNNFCPIVIIKVNEHDHWICSNKESFCSPGITSVISARDETTDVFTSAFLYGYLNGYSLKASASFGNLAQSSLGTESKLLPSTWEELKKKLK